jgi:hypothetical protein
MTLVGENNHTQDNGNRGQKGKASTDANLIRGMKASKEAHSQQPCEHREH